jgi:putative RecB family exonuclease
MTSQTEVPPPEAAAAGIPQQTPDVDRRNSLSPSRASDFQSCPLRYRLRHIDRIPEPPGVEAYRGTLVHAVLERLFDLPAAERTAERAAEMLTPQWQRMASELAEEDLLPLLFGPAENWERWQAGEPLAPAEPGAEEAFLAAAGERLARYFAMEDPSLLEPAEREFAVSAELADGLVLRGFIDRLDRAPDGRTRVVDYKTGRAPREAFEQQAMFQLRCYALALWRRDGRAPTVLQLLYLGDGQVLRYQPDEADLRATERKLGALWQAILRAYESGDWRPRPSKLCDYCSYQALCPAFGGVLPDAPGIGTSTVES